MLFPGCDGLFYFYPLTLTGMEQWRQGIVPLWTNLVQCGFPLLADGQGALLYPLNLLAFLTLPGPIANNSVIVLQALMSALFMYAFARTLGIMRWGAVMAGWIWTLCGPVTATLGSPALNGLTWWPLWFLLAHQLAMRVEWRMVAIAGLSMGVGWLGGFPQTTLYGIFGSSLYLIFKIFTFHGKKWRQSLFSIAGWALAGIGGMGIGAVQIIPTLEMSLFSIRAGGGNFAFTTLGSMFPTGFAGFFIPGWNHLFEFSLAGPNLFIGLVCLAVALLTLHRKNNNRTILFFWGLALLGCLLAMGKYTPLIKCINILPGFNYFRYPYRFIYLSLFSLSILAAFGFNLLIPVSAHFQDHVRKMVIRLSAVTGVTILIIVGGLLLFSILKTPIVTAIRSYALETVLHKKFGVQNLDYYHAKVSRMIGEIINALDPFQAGLIVALLVAFTGIGILFVILYKPQWGRRCVVALYIISLINILFIAGKVNAPSQGVIVAPPLADYCHRGESNAYRLYNVNLQKDIIRGFYSFDRIDANSNLLFDIAHIGVYSALGSLRYHELLGRLGAVNLALGVPPVREEDIEQHHAILNLLNVRYVVSNEPLHSEQIHKEPYGTPFLYRNDQAMPRAFVVPEARVIENSRDLLDSMHSAAFNPWTVVLLESAPHGSPERGNASPARILSYRDRNIRLEADGPGWLVVTDLFYPGWSARVDGKEVPVYRGDYVFKTLPLDQGTHTVEFMFESQTFRNGLVITTITLLFVLLLFAAGQIRTKRKNGGSLYLTQHR
ncbi:MAG: YfhO family protein [Chitinispirillaceae bacterium]|nr:YfhO family protein [Chitinispirillaceae bacterium]